jgi:hypothetical protein
MCFFWCQKSSGVSKVLVSAKSWYQKMAARHSAFQEAIKGLALTFHKSGGMFA